MSGIKILATQEWVNSAITAALGGSIVGMVDENNNIILTGDLDAGTYYLKYEGKDGSIIDIGNLFYEGSLGESFTVPVTWNVGYAVQTDVNSPNLGNRYTAENYAASDRMPLKDNYVYTVYGENWTAGDSCYAMWYTASGGFIKSGKIADGDGWSSSASGNVSFVLNPPEGAGEFRLQSYCGSDFSQSTKIVVEATINRTKKYSTIPLVWQEGVKLNKTNGTVEATGTNYSASDFIAIENKSYTVYGTSLYSYNVSLVFYDANKNFVSYVADVINSGESIGEHTFVPPTNAAYLRLRIYSTTEQIWRYKCVWMDLKKVANYTNVLSSAIGYDGNVLNGVGYINGYRLASNQNTTDNYCHTSADSTHFATGYIPYTLEDAENKVPFFVKGVNLETSNLTSNSRICLYESPTIANPCSPSELSNSAINGVTIRKLDELYYKITPNDNFHYANAYSDHNMQYVRFSMPGSGAGVIITINEPIEDATYTNVLKTSTDVNGEPYNGGLGYKEGYRYSQSGGGDVAGDGLFVTGYIKCKRGDTLYFKNVGMNKDAGVTNGCNVYLFDSLSATSSSSSNVDLINSYHSPQWDSNGDIISMTTGAETSNADCWIRFNTTYLGTESVITINEPIA